MWRTSCFVLGMVVAMLVSAAARGEVRVGDQPKLVGRALDGSTIDLSQFRGKLVLVDFWTSRSDLDRNNERVLGELHKKYPIDDGLVMIGVNCDARADEAARFVSMLGVTWPQVFNGSADWRRVGPAAEWGVPRLNWDYLIGPDGMVLWIGDPKRAEPAIQDALLNHPPQLVDPATLKSAHQELDAVENALTQQDRASAVLSFVRIKPEAKKDREFAKRYAAVGEKVSAAADAMLAEVEPALNAKEYPLAAVQLSRLAELFKGLAQETKAREKLAALLADPQAKAALDSAQREGEAAAGLAMARKLRDDGSAGAAYRKFKAVAQDYPGTEPGKQAADAVASYEKDAKFMQQLRDDEVVAKAKPLLSMAASYRAAGKLDLAREKYQEVIDQFPGTRFALAAQQALQEMSTPGR